MLMLHRLKDFIVAYWQRFVSSGHLVDGFTNQLLTQLPWLPSQHFNILLLLYAIGDSLKDFFVKSTSFISVSLRINK